MSALVSAIDTIIASNPHVDLLFLDDAGLTIKAVGSVPQDVAWSKYAAKDQVVAVTYSNRRFLVAQHEGFVVVQSAPST